MNLLQKLSADLEGRGSGAVRSMAAVTVGLRRVLGGAGLAEESLALTRKSFEDSFFSQVDPREALKSLNAMNEAIAVFGGRGGIRDLYLSSASECIPMLSQAEGDFWRYMVCVYADTLALGLVGEADKLWGGVRSRRRVPPKWKGARLLVEAETRVTNRQASGIDLARRAYSTFGTGEFAARACYLLALDRMGKGKSGEGWAVAGLDALGGARTEEGNLGLVARLEMVAAGFDREKLGRRELKWRRRMSFRQVAERTLRDLGRVEAPVSA